MNRTLWKLRNLWLNVKWWVYWHTVGILTGEEKQDQTEYERLHSEGDKS